MMSPELERLDWDCIVSAGQPSLLMRQAFTSLRLALARLWLPFFRQQRIDFGIADRPDGSLTKMRISTTFREGEYRETRTVVEMERTCVVDLTH